MTKSLCPIVLLLVGSLTLETVSALTCNGAELQWCSTCAASSGCSDCDFGYELTLDSSLGYSVCTDEDGSGDDDDCTGREALTFGEACAACNSDSTVQIKNCKACTATAFDCTSCTGTNYMLPASYSNSQASDYCYSHGNSLMPGPLTTLLVLIVTVILSFMSRHI